MNPTVPDLHQPTPRLEKIVHYLQQNGWQPISCLNPKLRVFQGKEDDLGKPIQLVLPQSMEFSDSSLILSRAIDVLAALAEETPEQVLVAIESEDDNINQSSFLDSPQLTGQALLAKVLVWLGRGFRERSN